MPNSSRPAHGGPASTLDVRTAAILERFRAGGGLEWTELAIVRVRLRRLLAGDSLRAELEPLRERIDHLDSLEQLRRWFADAEALGVTVQ